MAKVILALSIFLFLSLHSNAQNGVTVKQLIGFANTTTRSDFDTKVRALGYSFEKKDVRESSITSIYTKRIATSTRNYTFILSYEDYKDNKPVIRFECSSNSLLNFLSSIKQQAIASNFVEKTENCPDADENSIVFCYEHPQYSLHIYDIPIREEEQTYNHYKIKIYKK